MNYISTILVDDEPRGLSSLQKLLEHNCPQVQIVALCSSADEAKAAIVQHQPQLVFLDIAMPEKTGFDLLEEMGERKFEVIFVTAHSDFMLQAFRFSCVDYLLKPVVDDLLQEAVIRAGQRISESNNNSNIETLLYNLKAKEQGQKPKICITSLKGFRVINLSDIVYLEANSNYTLFHLENKTSIVASKTIAEYEPLLEDSGFMRIHKSFIVNLEHIKEYNRGEGGTVILPNNVELDVSRRKKDLFMEKMKAFYKF